MEALVTLSADHPGFRDQAYRERRNAIARLAADYVPGTLAPTVDYSATEIQVWQTAWQHLDPLHQRYAAIEYLESSEAVRLARDEVPQLRDVNEQLNSLTRFSMLPVGGLVSSRGFMVHLGSSTFLSTQYMRHPSMPLYTPEPDVIHELIGHAATLGHPLFAELNRAFGAASEVASDADITRIERVYWYSLEFGLAKQNGRIKAYGAGLLSSFGELGRVEQGPTLHPWNTDEVTRTPHDPTQYQKTLFVAEQGFPALARELIDWLGQWR